MLHQAPGISSSSSVKRVRTTIRLLPPARPANWLLGARGRPNNDCGRAKTSGYRVARARHAGTWSSGSPGYGVVSGHDHTAPPLAPPGLPKPTTISRVGDETASYGLKPAKPGEAGSHFHA